jgi:hypothetical protein
VRTVAREDDGIPDAISNSRARRRSLRLGGKEPAFEAAIVAIQLRPMRSAANTPLPAHRLGSEAALSPSPPAGNGSWRFPLSARADIPREAKSPSLAVLR